VSTAVKIVVALALALNVRAGALLYLGYLVALVAACALTEHCTNWWRLAGTAARLAAVAVVVLLLGTIFWPWAQAAPLTRPFQALLGVSHFRWGGLVLFNGREYRANELPWYYAPWWFLISTPPVVIVGVVLSTWPSSSRCDALRMLALWVIAVLPVAAAIVKGSTLYDGIRHLEFIYPILVVLATSGWTAVLCARGRPWLRRIAAAGLALGLAGVLIIDVRFHPNQGVYFNALVGGPRGAFARYDMDYWGNCIFQAVEWSAHTARSCGIPITISGNPWNLVQLNAQRFHEVKYTAPSRRRHYLHVRLARGSAEGLRALAQQPALYQVRTPDGAILCSVIPGPAFGEMKALLSRVAPGMASPQVDRQ
jgi:hypothetical protein